jgi:RHS repeat-associated protein
MFSPIYHCVVSFLSVLLLLFPGTSNALSTRSYSYDLSGNLHKIIDPRGFTTQYRYDLLDRLEEIEYPDGRNVKYSYDLSGNRTSIEDWQGVTLFEPDEFGQIKKVTFPNGKIVSYDYDTEGNLIKLAYPDNTEVEYTYDLANRLKSVKDFSGTTRFEYDESNNSLKKKTLPNGISTEYRYHLNRKISNVIHKRPNDELIEEFRYDYDENGNRTKIEKISPKESSNVIYTYDKLDRVTKAQYSNGFFETFSYDGAGNRRTKTTPQGTINYDYDEENRLKKAGDVSYEYDLAGNLIKKTSPGHEVKYTYDFENRLISYSDESKEVFFEYDGDGNRIAKTVNGIRTEYINDLVAPVSQVLLKKVGGKGRKPEASVIYVYGGSRISQSTGGKSEFYLYDSMGRNVSGLVSSSGTLLNRYDYDTFGSLLSAEQNAQNSYQYSGEEFDEETGLVFLRNRYYDPEIGRFISKDACPGRLDRPSTLNPYCYVENNPVNFVDPLGFEGIDPEKWERVRLHINDLPAVCGGQGSGGHACMEFPDRNLFQGNYPKRMETYDQKNINKNTTTIECYCRSDKVDKGIEVMRNIKWTASKNCVYTAVEGMKEMGFVHADKVRLSKVLPLPSELRSRMLELHGRDPRIITYPRERVIIKHPPSASARLQVEASPSLDFGGISLSKAAELKLNISDITGAAFDPATGQIVLFGPENHYLPSFDVDDIAVAVRSIYGLGTHIAADPGISIDEYLTPGNFQVRFDGATANTSFGQVMFEADYLLKSLTVGKDYRTGQLFMINVPGYASLVTRLESFKTSGHIDTRMWFVPEQITLMESEDHGGMVFSDVRMKVLHHTEFNGAQGDFPVCREFAEHFTAHYDEFAQQFPIFEKLKQLGKITAIVKWIKDNNVPFDTGFFAQYQPKFAETPSYVSPVSNSKEILTHGTEKRRVKGHKNKKKVPVTYTHTISLAGGVTYKLNHHNFKVQQHPIAGEFAFTALKSRPSENDFSWTFSSPTNRETFVAIAQNICRTRKPGNVKKSYVDMSFPLPGYPLVLYRFYNSFSEKDSPFGYGWRLAPYEIEFPENKVQGTSSMGIEISNYPLILVRTPEREDFYHLTSLDADNCPIFIGPTQGHTLRDNLDGTFTLKIPHEGAISFDQQGRLLSLKDQNDCTIEYKYEGSQLKGIYHQNGSAILLEYHEGRIAKATGPGNSYVRYEYENGQLVSVWDATRILSRYAYDSDKRLRLISDQANNIFFEATYDDYNRAKTFKEGDVTYQSDFSLEQKNMKVTDDQGGETLLQFDSQDRLTYRKEPSGLSWKFIYETENQRLPNKIIGPKKDVTECRYDARGNLKYFKNAADGEWAFFYDNNSNLKGHREPNGNCVVSFYDNNRLTRSYLKATLTDENAPFTVDSRYSIKFNYDPKTGLLANRKNTRGGTTMFKYDENGYLARTTSPSGYTINYKMDAQGKIREISDEFGIQKSYQYDEFNQVKSITTAAGETVYDYQESGDPRQLLDPRKNITYFDYDSHHNLKEVIDAEGGKSTYEYNPMQQLEHVQLSNGTCMTLEYDLSTRTIREIYGR